MRFHPLSALVALAPAVAADFSISLPAAGGVPVPAGIPMIVTIGDTGNAPSISTFQTFTLELIQGGQDEGAGQQLVTTFASAAAYPVPGNQITGTVPVAAASELANSFFFKLTSFASSGGSYINWSDRFSISGLAGPAAPAAVLAAVTALAGATAGPGPINKLGSGGAPGGDGLFDVPFNLQTGLTRYAPMQPIPPTKITAKVFKPLFPTSAYTIAISHLPNPTVQKTVTQPQTFSASSIENPAAPASMPTDMAKYLKRWQDE